MPLIQILMVRNLLSWHPLTRLVRLRVIQNVMVRDQNRLIATMRNARQERHGFLTLKVTEFID